MKDTTTSRDGFRRYLKAQSESILWVSGGDDARDGAYCQTGAASCFFPVAVRELVKDGLNPKHIAQVCLEGAMEALMAGGASLEEAEQELLRLVLANRITGKDPQKPPQ